MRTTAAIIEIIVAFIIGIILEVKDWRNNPNHDQAINKIEESEHDHDQSGCLEEVEPNKLRIFVREPAERNLANKRVLTLVANFYEIPQNRLKIITGHRGQNKIIQVID
jgi:uncharacterized protein YggU (UPF0235/DUF167 family)